MGFNFADNDSLARAAIGTPSTSGQKPIYDEASQVPEKLAAAKQRWSKMIGEVRKALNAKTPSKPNAQSAIANNMNQLKTDMRVVSKSLVGGDITTRSETVSGQNIAEFNYNTGQFKLQPLPERAEGVFCVINDLYANELNMKTQVPVEKAIARVDEAEAKFSEWVSMVDAAMR